MNIISDPNKDIRTTHRHSGSYEWWYFDAISTDGRYSFVIIFYEGNPFSPSYINAQQDHSNTRGMPSDFPAVSISIYENDTPIYYSFTEYDAHQCAFDEDQPMVEMGQHRMVGEHTENELSYKLHLHELLPSGDAIEADLRFNSPPNRVNFDSTHEETAGHQWNLVQPRNKVTGTIRTGAKDKEERVIPFEGIGYHDHNTGHEPMKNEFDDWYWGRFHFSEATLVYYVMNRQAERQYCAWLIDSESNIIESFDDIELMDKSISCFGLSMSHKINIGSEKTKIQIQQSTLLDNGPFYRRFLSEGFLRMESHDIPEVGKGITEYIYPSRIYSRLFWPLVNMRIRRSNEPPHWVQRSPRLYRWTW